MTASLTCLLVAPIPNGALLCSYRSCPRWGRDNSALFHRLISSLQLADVNQAKFPFRMLQQAITDTIAQLMAWTKEAGTTEPSLLNFCVSDGHSIIATRYISSKTDEAASLWFSTGSVGAIFVSLLPR